MTEPRTRQTRLNRLKELAAQAGPALYERVKLATELLDGAEGFVSGKHSGDQSKAAEDLQASYFADLDGLMGVVTMADIFRAYPTEEFWKDKRYNLQRMHSMWWEATHPNTETTKGNRSRATLEMIEDRDTQIARQSRQLDEAEKKIKQTQAETKSLTDRVRDLERENAELRGEIRALRDAMNMKATAA